MKRSSQRWLRSIPIILALVFFGMGIFITTDLLVSLGPMRRSLTSPIQSVQRMAYYQVLIFRVFCFVMATGCAAVAILWNHAIGRKLFESSLIQRIKATAPLETTRHSDLMHWGNKSLIIFSICIFIVILYLEVATNIISEDLFQFITGEDGVIESMSALLLFGCSIVSAMLSFKFSDQKARVLMHRLFALGFFVMLGEEISWGQRLLNLETPAPIKGINLQDETNLHNLFGFFTTHLLLLIVFFYGVIIPLLSYKNPFFRKLFNFIGLPVASPGLSIGFLVVLILNEPTLRHILPPLPWRVLLSWSESQELLVDIGLCLLMYESWLLVPDGKNVRVSRV